MKSKVTIMLVALTIGTHMQALQKLETSTAVRKAPAAQQQIRTGVGRERAVTATKSATVMQKSGSGSNLIKSTTVSPVKAQQFSSAQNRTIRSSELRTGRTSASLPSNPNVASTAVTSAAPVKAAATPTAVAAKNNAVPAKFAYSPDKSNRFLKGQAVATQPKASNAVVQKPVTQTAPAAPKTDIVVKAPVTSPAVSPAPKVVSVPTSAPVVATSASAPAITTSATSVTAAPSPSVVSPSSSVEKATVVESTTATTIAPVVTKAPLKVIDPGAPVQLQNTAAQPVSPKDGSIEEQRRYAQEVQRYRDEQTRVDILNQQASFENKAKMAAQNNASTVIDTPGSTIATQAPQQNFGASTLGNATSPYLSQEDKYKTVGN